MIDGSRSVGRLHRVALGGTFAVILALLPQCAHAQDLRLADGQRARVTIREQSLELEGAVSQQVLRGTLLRVAPDTLVIRIHPGTGPLTLGRSAIDRVEVSHGVRSRLESALRTVPRAALLGAAEWYVLESISDDRVFDDSWEGLFVGAGIGAVVGAIWGAFHPQERWREAAW